MWKMVLGEEADGRLGSILRPEVEPINRPSWRLARVRYAPVAIKFHIAAK